MSVRTDSAYLSLLHECPGDLIYYWTAFSSLTLYTTGQHSVHCLICYIAIASQVALFSRVFFNRYLKIKELLWRFLFRLWYSWMSWLVKFQIVLWLLTWWKPVQAVIILSKMFFAGNVLFSFGLPCRLQHYVLHCKSNEHRALWNHMSYHCFWAPWSI